MKEKLEDKANYLPSKQLVDTHIFDQIFFPYKMFCDQLIFFVYGMEVQMFEYCVRTGESFNGANFRQN